MFACVLLCVYVGCVCVICSLAWYAVVHFGIKARVTELVEKPCPTTTSSDLIEPESGL